MHARAVKAEIVRERNDADFVVGLGCDCNLDVYDFATINAPMDIINPIIKKMIVHLLKKE